MPAIFASSGLPVEEHYRRFGRPGGPMRQVSLDELLASANRQSQSIRDFEQESGLTAMDRIRDFAKAASSEPTLLGTGVSAGLGGPLGGGIYAGIKDESFLTGLLALLASGAAAGGGAHLAHKGVGAALGRFAPMVQRGMAGLRKGEKLVTPGAAGWDRAMRWSRPAGSAAGAMAGTYGVSTLASDKAASDTSSILMPLTTSLLEKFAGIEAQADGFDVKKLLAQLALVGSGGLLGRGMGHFIGERAGRVIGAHAGGDGLGGGLRRGIDTLQSKTPDISLKHRIPVNKSRINPDGHIESTMSMGSLESFLNGFGVEAAQRAGAYTGGNIGARMGANAGTGLGLFGGGAASLAIPDSKKSASFKSMSAIAYSISRFHKIAHQQQELHAKQAAMQLARGGMQLARGAARPAERAMKNVTPRGMGGAASSFAMPSLRQSVNVTKAPGLRDYLGQAGNWAKQEWKKSPTGFAAQVGLPAYAGYKELVSDPRHMRDGARMGAEGTLNQMSDYMGNAGLMERLGFLLNPQGASNQMREMGMQQILQALG